MDTDQKRQADQGESTMSRKRGYRSPAVIDSTAFETLALTCGKEGGALCNARGGPSSS